ncbi:glutathione S-transferase-like [Battus philenor]|uniref:glutathione S-transferase-like n=1 Tax=Battus philenor TaxID=42288 RepID=UPI0035CEE505
MAQKLHYFDSNGIAESIRYLFYYGGEKFEDIRYDFKAWPDKKIQDLLPFGQLPLYEEGGAKLNQTLAIARYVAYKVNLLPNDPWEQAVLDSLALTIYDFWFKIVTFLREKDPVRRMAIQKEILDESVNFYFTRFEKQLKENKGYFIGKLTWVDFVFVSFVETLDFYFDINVEKKYPTVEALMKKIFALPGVKEYVAARKPYEKFL